MPSSHAPRLNAHADRPPPPGRGEQRVAGSEGRGAVEDLQQRRPGSVHTRAVLAPPRTCPRGNGPPETRYKAPEAPPRGDQGPDERAHAALETARRADARHLAHDEAQIGAAGLHEKALPDVGMPSQVPQFDPERSDHPLEGLLVALQPRGPPQRSRPVRPTRLFVTSRRPSRSTSQPDHFSRSLSPSRKPIRSNGPSRPTPHPYLVVVPPFDRNRCSIKPCATTSRHKSTL